MALNPKRVVLDNGITVIAKANHTSPTVSLLVGVRTGAYSDPPDRDGTASLCARVLDRGTAKRSADVIADELDGRGASLSVIAGRHQMALAATCLADDFDPVLALVADVARHPAYADKEIATRRGTIPMRARSAAPWRASRRSAARTWCASIRRDSIPR
jgi:zinc protease